MKMTERKTAKEYPLLPLRGVYVFPGVVVPLEVGRSMSINAVDEAMAGDRLIVLATKREIDLDQPTPEDIYRVGTLDFLSLLSNWQTVLEYEMKYYEVLVDDYKALVALEAITGEKLTS